MREIKFRAWHKGFSGQAPHMIHSDEVGLARLFEKFQTDSAYTLMQYTGLKDKNGVEIYEGDIVKHDHWSSKYTCENCGHTSRESATFTIQWQNEEITDYAFSSVARFSQKQIGERHGLLQDREYEFDDADQYVVIGNIYSPELSEEK